jgi:hypothetical protein
MISNDERKKDTISYILSENACQMWLVHPETSWIIVEKYKKHMRPYLHNLDSKIERMKKDMEEYDYVFEQQETGME